MKLALLISMLAVGGIFAREVQVTVEGTLKCSRPFHHRIFIYEMDKFVHDRIGYHDDYSDRTVHTFKATGKAYDGWPEQYVEPRMYLWHNCEPSIENECFCKNLGDIWQDLHVKFDLNLDNFTNYRKDFKRCDCEYVLTGDRMFRK